MVERIIKNQPLEVAVVRYPGSNCDWDTLEFFNRNGHHAQFLWHKDTYMPEAELLVLCGGFAFGDRVYDKATGLYLMNPGAQALKSPVHKTIERWVGKGRPTLGICNGLQILALAGMVPGKLELNNIKTFYCDDVDVAVEGPSFFNDRRMLGNVYRINIAHKYGRYVVTPEEYASLIAKNQIFLRYQGINPNGSVENIAGVCDEAHQVFGMMPHPERTDQETQLVFLEAIENYVRS